MPNKARPQTHRLRVCPTCQTPKYREEFRQSNRNRNEFNPVCWHCRNEDRRAEAKSYGVNFRRYDSVFRQTFHAINRRLKKKLSKKEVMRLSKNKVIEKQSVDLIRFPGRIAAIVAKTFVVRGDDEQLPLDVAMMKIRDLLDDLDDTLIERNKNKRLSS